MNRSLTMNRFLAISYGAASYVAFLAAFVYAVGFVAAAGVPRSVSHGLTAPPGQTVAVNVLLLGCSPSSTASWRGRRSNVGGPDSYRRLLSAARTWLLSSAVPFLLYWQWRTVPAVVWDVTSPAGRLALWALFWLGWAMALAATFLISHFDLFGLRPGVSGLPRKALHRPRFSCSAVCTDSCATRSCSASSSPSGPHRR